MRNILYLTHIILPLIFLANIRYQDLRRKKGIWINYFIFDMDLLNSVSGGTEEGHTQNELKKVNKAEIQHYSGILLDCFQSEVSCVGWEQFQIFIK